MNKLKAARDFPHGSRWLKEGDAFEASDIDMEYYTTYGYAVRDGDAAVQAPERNQYGRKDMRAQDLRSVALSSGGQTEARGKEQASAQTNAKAKAKTEALTTASAISNVPQAAPTPAARLQTTAPMAQAPAPAPAAPAPAPAPAAPATAPVRTPEQPAGQPAPPSPGDGQGPVQAIVGEAGHTSTAAGVSAGTSTTDPAGQ